MLCEVVSTAAVLFIMTWLELVTSLEVHLQLVNFHGKCLAVFDDHNVNGVKIVQAECDPSQKGQSWIQEPDSKLLCNGWGKCLFMPVFLNVSMWLVQQDPGLLPGNGDSIRGGHWNFGTHHRVLNAWGNCLGTIKPDDATGGSEVWVSPCYSIDRSHPGQLWGWMTTVSMPAVAARQERVKTS